jgi:hypothetical protein
LEVGIEPYKQDNARLIQECNHLNKKLIAQKDQHTDVQKGKSSMSINENAWSFLLFDSDSTIQGIKKRRSTPPAK